MQRILSIFRTMIKELSVKSIRYSRIHTCYFEEMTVHDMKIVFLDDSKEHPIPIKIIPVQQLSSMYCPLQITSNTYIRTG